MDERWAEALSRANALLERGDLDEVAQIAHRVREEAVSQRELCAMGTTEHRSCTLTLAHAHVVLQRCRKRRSSIPPPPSPTT